MTNFKQLDTFYNQLSKVIEKNKTLSLQDKITVISDLKDVLFQRQFSPTHSKSQAIINEKLNNFFGFK